MKVYGFLFALCERQQQQQQQQRLLSCFVLFCAYLPLFGCEGRVCVARGLRYFQIHVVGKRFFAGPAQNMFPQQPAMSFHAVLFHNKPRRGNPDRN